MSYPVMLRLEGRLVVFVGGGRETVEKVAGLVDCGARVRLISPYDHDVIEGVEWQRRPYRDGDLEGAWLAFAHLPEPSGHAPIFAEAERRGIWCNSVDVPACCSFTMPAVHRRGDLVVSISTGGSAPALAARLRQRLSKELGPEYGEFLEMCRGLRGPIQERYATFAERRDAWYRVVDSPALALLRQGRPEEALRVATEQFAEHQHVAQ